MKKYIFLTLTSCVLAFFSSCDIDNSVEDVVPDLEVTASNTVIKAGEVVTFSLNSTAQNIFMYTGEAGRQYQFRNRTSAEGAMNRLVFTSNVTSTGQNNNLAVLASNDFSGIMDTNEIRKATWVDITSRCTLGTSTTNVASGTVNVSDLKSSRDTVFIAYRYKSDFSTSTARARAWAVGGFVFTNFFPDSTVHNHNTLNTNIRLGGFRAISFQNDSLNWAIGGSLTFPQAPIGGSANEDWAISHGFKMSRIQPDVAIAVQNASQQVTKYEYKFSKGGTYKVTFVATNQTKTGFMAEVTKELTITVQ